MARARSIGTMYAELTVQDKMTAKLATASKSVDKFASKMASIGKGMALAAPAAAFAGLAASMKSALDAGGKLSDMMAQTGAAGEGLFILQRAFENAGMAGDKVPAVINKMQKALAGLSDEGKRINTRVWSDLGLDTGMLQSMDPVQALQKIGQSLASIEDPAKRAALAMEIFGRSGGELLVMFNDPNAFAAASKQVGGLGQTLAANADRFDRISDSFALLGVKMQQVGAELAAEMLPTLEELVFTLENADLGKLIKQSIEVAKNFQTAAEFAQRFAPGTKDFGWLGKQWSKLTAGTERAQPLTPLDSWNFDPLTPLNPSRPAPDESWMTGPSYKTPNLDGIGPGAIDLTNAGVFGMGALAEIVDAIKYGTAFERIDPLDTDMAAPWESSRYNVSDMTRRGFGFGGEAAIKQANDQVDLLKEIRDTLKNAKLKENVLTWAL